MKQLVHLTGLGTPQFASFIGTLEQLREIYSREVPEGALDAAPASHYHQQPTIDISTRYLTSRTEDPSGKAKPFGSGVDPKGILARLAGDTHFHGEENQVLYFDMKMSGEEPM